MKILHTSDLHLTTSNNERWETLETLLNKAIEIHVDIFVISGDLFDSNKEAFTLYDKLRELFQKYNTKLLVIILPGNHDSKSYEKGRWLGDNVEIITKTTAPIQIKDLIFWGLPYHFEKDRTTIPKQIEKINKIIEKKYSDKKNILLFHGELLDLFSMQTDFGEEESGGYMPVKLSYFENSYFKYILAGHFHTKYHIFAGKNQNNEEFFFVYPGSPVSITVKETGKRSVNIFTPPLSPKKYIDFKTSYYDNLSLTLQPDHDPIKTINIALSEADKESKLLVQLNGYFDGIKYNIKESKIKEYFEKKLTGYNIHGEIDYNFKNIGDILDSNLYERINEKINNLEEKIEEKEIIRNIIIKGLIEARF